MAVRSRKIAKILVALLLAGLLPLLLFGCGAAEEETTSTSANTTENTSTNITEDKTMPQNTDATQNPVVTFTLADGKTIVAELYPDMAPNTVNNFIYLIKKGYYDGKVFHRAVPGFMIQGGSPDGSSASTGFPYAIKGEFANNGFTQNTLKHTPGVLSMARVQNMNDSASCQFFIMHGTSSFLDNDYAAFGKVTQGLDVVDTIANSPASSELLLTKVVIQTVTVETFGKTYPDPEILQPVG
jgi:peptidyl-prolyl cis-trans isomerase B (cyclophilin B)